MRSSRQWRAAVAKGTSRAVRLPPDADSASTLCRSGSPLLRHIGTVALDNDDSLSLVLMQQLHALPSLTALRAALGSAEQQQLLEQNGEQALCDLRTAFPSRLRELSLPKPNCTSATSQLLLDALPALPTRHEPTDAAVLPTRAAPSAASTEASAEPSRVSFGWSGDNSAAAEENRAGGARPPPCSQSRDATATAATRGGADKKDCAVLTTAAVRALCPFSQRTPPATRCRIHLSAIRLLSAVHPSPAAHPHTPTQYEPAAHRTQPER